ncbi:ankyrin repeat domain-containing protein [Wolbachia endosymbiont (group B) of Xanthorhoe designata]|uniref:ankyrin repeat domain-containing protein n=1 Tax=Wolbachia endosymbiont (group B) of Xanthorhoe designata TaxID=3066184 RepID=UPI0033427120
MSNLSALEKILWTINDDSKVDPSNIIEKLQSKLQQHDIDMYNQWKEDGFDINANSFDGSNLLCLASESGCVKVVEFLIEKDANVNIQDNEGKIPLDYAISSGREDVIKVCTEKILLHDDVNEGVLQISSEQEAEIGSQDQYETPLSYPLFLTSRKLESALN